MTNPTYIDHITNDAMTDAPVSFDFDRHGGMIRNFTIAPKTGSAIKPLHTAPWALEPLEIFDEISLVEQKLSGDFFCAPFGGNDAGPIHGATANGQWSRMQSESDSEIEGTVSTTYQLNEKVQGAVVTKKFSLHAGDPLLYQNHQLSGGEGHLPIGHHAMICVPGGANLSFSDKQFVATPAQAPEPDSARGTSLLKYPQKSDGYELMETQSGERLDIYNYPFADNHEELVIMAERSASQLGWTAALAQHDGFLFFAIKDVAVLPETLLWMSNGGRNYAPWLGRHKHVLGIEEVSTSCHNDGTFGSIADISPYGLPQGLVLSAGRTSNINYAFGAIAPPSGWTEIKNIEINADSLVFVDVSGDTHSVPFYGAHFGL